MVIQKKNYDQTKNKLHVMWEQANQLIAQYEEYDKRILDLEDKYNQLINSINSTLKSF